MQRPVAVWRRQEASAAEESSRPAWSIVPSLESDARRATPAPASVLGLAEKADQVVAQVQQDGTG
ncbi:MAG: hypothetical protein AAF266_04555, partial [Planctomycetota bacterium]